MRRSDALVKRLHARTAALVRSVKPRARKPAVFVVLGNAPVFTVGNGSYIENLIELAGGRNAASDIQAPYARYSAEALVARQPDVLDRRPRHPPERRPRVNRPGARCARSSSTAFTRSPTQRSSNAPAPATTTASPGSSQRSAAPGDERRSANFTAMDTLAYRVILEPDEDGYRVIIPAFPRVFTCGDSVEDALRMAADAIALELTVA